MPTEQRLLDATVHSRALATLEEAMRLLDSMDQPEPGEPDGVEFVDQLELLRSKLRKTVAQHVFDREVFEVPFSQRDTVTTANCPVCGTSKAEPRFGMEGLPYPLVVCNDCGLGSLNPAPSNDDVASFYPSEYYGTSGAKFRPFVESLVRVVGARHVRSLAKGLPKGARVLDVGCGRGVLLSALADRGFQAHGFEVSETAAAGADGRAEVRIADDLQQAKYPDAYFDEVILWHVLEHLGKPRETLAEIRRILRPGGRLVVSVPNFSSHQAHWAAAGWFHLDLPRHLYHFPLPALRRLISTCGFQVRSEHHFSLRQNPFGWLQSFLNRGQRVPRNSLYRILKNDTAGDEFLGPALCWQQRVAFVLGMPFALALSVLEAVVRNGASVCLMAEAVLDDRRDS